jgi:hypothetical protein
MAGEQDRRILKAAATSKRSKGSGGGGGGGAAAANGAKDAKTFQAGVGGQADAASLLLEGLLLKVGGRGWVGGGGGWAAGASGESMSVLQLLVWLMGAPGVFGDVCLCG